MSFKWPINEMTDAEVRKMLEYADMLGYPRAGRTLVLPPRREVIGEVYGVKVVRDGVQSQQPYMTCEVPTIRTFSMSDAE